MKICIKNGMVLSMAEQREIQEEKIDILINGNKIVRIGRNIEIDEETKVINAKGKVVLPGLINTHAHVPMSIFRETLDGYNLQDWLTQKIWPMEDKLTNQDIYFASFLSFIEMIKTGTTTINDMYFMTEDIIKAMKESGIRLQTTRTLMGKENDEIAEQRLKELEKLINKYNKEDRLSINVGIHGLYTSSSEYIDKCVQLAEKYQLPINMHFCENAQEVEDIKQVYQKMPIEVINDKFKNKKLLLAHSVKLNKNDIDKLDKQNISIAHCPVSNLKLGCGIADITYMDKIGINVSLGTDGQGSGSNLDLFETMKFTALLQKGKYEDSKLMPAYEVLKMATINGAKALGLEKDIGSIEEGKIADIIILDLEDTKIKPINNLISEIVYNVKGNNVSTTIINGKILMENKQLINCDEQKIYESCNEIINRISK